MRQPRILDLPTGTPVYDVEDPRHIGRLEGILLRTFAVIRWYDTPLKLKSHVRLHKVRVATAEML